MRLIIQRVTEAQVNIDNELHSRIDRGLLVLLGVEQSDTDEDLEWLVHKLIGLRVFSDDNGLMNLSLKDVGGELLVVSQFTLHASVKKGMRPSFVRAASPDLAIPLYEKFIQRCSQELDGKVESGKFGAMMQVGFVNDGPVTIIMDSKNKSL